MKEKTLDQAIAEARRFLKIANELKTLQNLTTVALYERTGRWSTIAESGAMKRASMDLTRVLAELRKPWVYD